MNGARVPDTAWSDRHVEQGHSACVDRHRLPVRQGEIVGVAPAVAHHQRDRLSDRNFHACRHKVVILGLYHDGSALRRRSKIGRIPGRRDAGRAGCGLVTSTMTGGEKDQRAD